MCRSSFISVVLLLCAATRAVAAPACLDGRFLVTGASPFAAPRARELVMEIDAGIVSIPELCAAPGSVVIRGDVQFTARWRGCGSSRKVVLKASRLGSDCSVLTGSLRTTRGGTMHARRIRAVRLDPATPAIIPRPADAWSLGGESPFLVTELTEVLVQRHQPDVAAVATQLVADLQRQGLTTGAVRPLRGSRQPRNSVLLTTEGADPSLGAEGYSIRVTSSRVILRAPTIAGLFYAVQSLRQLMPVELDGPPASGAVWSIPALAIDDQPRFRWRGFMLDVSRTFYPIAALHRWVDLLALHKLNVFHLHLTDDQGWRVESQAFPALHIEGSRFDPVLAPNEVGGYYSTADLQDLVSYAAARHVEIVPEIEMPWHVAAMLHAIPSLACQVTPDVPRLASEFPIIPWGMILFPPPTDHLPVLCVCDPAAMATVETLIDEITRIFPSRYIHLGGDEVSSATWTDAYLCSDMIAAEGLSGVDDLQAWFSKRLEDMLRARGRILVGWDEVHEQERPGPPATTLSDTFTTMHWRRRYAPANLLDRDVIQALDNPYYLDLDLPLHNTYLFEPVAADVTPVQAAHVLGVQASMWTNQYRTQADLDRRAFPRLVAVAETAWTPRERKDEPSFLTRWERHAERLGLLGVAVSE